MKTDSSSSGRTIVTFGVPFHNLTLAEAVDRVSDAIARRIPSYCATANLDFALQARRDAELQRILVEADYVLCDGMPLVWASRLVGAPLCERVAGSDLVPALLASAARKGWRVFLLGGSAESLAAALASSRRLHPRLHVDGYSPPMASLLEMDHDEIAARIEVAAPDLLLVGLGCPKQEKWIYMNYRRLGVPVSIGIGATIDFLAGKYSRAPRWVSAIGAEWLYRFAQEPRRLGSRYLADLWFLRGALIRDWRLSLRAGRPAPAAVSDATEKLANISQEIWRGDIDASAIAAGRVPAANHIPGHHLAIDASGVTFLDSSGLGLLLKRYRDAVRTGGTFFLIEPSTPVRHLLQMVNLERLLKIVDRSELTAASDSMSRQMRYVLSEEEITIHLTGEVTAHTASILQEQIALIWRQHPEFHLLILDLSKVAFIDSSGLGLLISSYKLAGTRPKGKFLLRRISGNALDTLRLAQLERILPIEHAAA